MKTIIVDLDNCISDDEWRLDRIRHNEQNFHLRYHDYHEACISDELCNRDIIEQDYRIAIITGRPLTYMPMTIQWLVNRGIRFDHLIMRNRYDYSNSVSLKRKMFWWLINYYDVAFEDIVCAYDDRQDIVNMYIEEGIKAEVRAINNNDSRRI